MKTNFLIALGVTLLSLAISVNSTLALEIVTSVKPVQALVARIMGDQGQPYLIVKGSASPHTYAMRPDDAAALEQADIVFWVGPQLEAFLAKPLETLAAKAEVVSLAQTPNLLLLPQREGGAFDAHDHANDAIHDDEDEHHEEIDPHFWLDPLNAKLMVGVIVRRLQSADPQNADSYAQNALYLLEELDQLVAELTFSLQPVAQKPFVVFHDAFHYFENRFGLSAIGAITVNPDAIAGVQRIAQIQQVIKSSGAVCVFAEPQFEPKLVRVVLENSQAKSGILDPLGTTLPDGPDHYVQMIRALATAFKACLAT